MGSLLYLVFYCGGFATFKKIFSGFSGLLIKKSWGKLCRKLIIFEIFKHFKSEIIMDFFEDVNGKQYSGSK